MTCRLFVVGCSFFVVLFVLGLLTTAVVRDHALRDLPRTEVYEALYRDSLAIQWSCGGWAVSFVVSIIGAAAAVQFAKGRRR